MPSSLPTRDFYGWSVFGLGLAGALRGTHHASTIQPARFLFANRLPQEHNFEPLEFLGPHKPSGLARLVPTNKVLVSDSIRKYAPSCSPPAGTCVAKMLMSNQSKSPVNLTVFFEFLGRPRDSPASTGSLVWPECRRPTQIQDCKITSPPHRSLTGQPLWQRMAPSSRNCTMQRITCRGMARTWSGSANSSYAELPRASALQSPRAVCVGRLAGLQRTSQEAGVAVPDVEGPIRGIGLGDPSHPHQTRRWPNTEKSHVMCQPDRHRQAPAHNVQRPGGVLRKGNIRVCEPPRPVPGGWRWSLPWGRDGRNRHPVRPRPAIVSPRKILVPTSMRHCEPRPAMVSPRKILVPTSMRHCEPQAAMVSPRKILVPTSLCHCELRPAIVSRRIPTSMRHCQPQARATPHRRAIAFPSNSRVGGPEQKLIHTNTSTGSPRKCPVPRLSKAPCDPMRCTFKIFRFDYNGKPGFLTQIHPLGAPGRAWSQEAAPCSPPTHLRRPHEMPFLAFPRRKQRKTQEHFHTNTSSPRPVPRSRAARSPPTHLRRPHEMFFFRISVNKTKENTRTFPHTYIQPQAMLHVPHPRICGNPMRCKVENFCFENQ